MAVNLSPLGGAGWQFFDNSGVPLAGGLLYTYEAGTTTPLVTYTTVAATIANTNPIVLDAAGRPPSEIWLSSVAYKLVLKTSTGVLLWTMDNISGLPSAGQQAYATATAGQTTFTPPSYTVGFINVFRNGVMLGSADFTATNGTSVVLAAGASAGDFTAATASTDGFVVGDTAYINGSYYGNDGAKTITALSATVMTDSEDLVVESTQSRWVSVRLQVPYDSAMPGSYPVRFSIATANGDESIHEKLEEKSVFLMPR
jgi:hypothetical protein